MINPFNVGQFVLATCDSMDGNIGRSVHHFGPKTEMSQQPIRWIAMIFGIKYIHCPQRMNPNDFVDPLLFHLEPPACQNVYLLSILNK